MTGLSLARLLAVLAFLVVAALAQAPAARGADLEDAWVYKASVSQFAPMVNQWRYYPVASDPVVCESFYAVSSNSRQGCVARYKQQSWSAAAIPSGSLESRSPWWIDSNHNHVSGAPGQTGLGFINVIAQLTPIQTSQAPLDLTGATVGFKAKKDALFEPLTASIRGGKTRKGHLYFWFETAPRALTGCTPDLSTGEDCTRESDYIMSAIESDPATGDDVPYQIDSWLTPGVWRQFYYQFTAGTQWTCLGRGANVKYECAPIETALKNVMHFGFVVAPVCTAPDPSTPNPFYLCSANAPTAEANSNKGTIYLDEVTISRPRSTAVEWTSLVNTVATGSGSGLQKNSTAGADWNAGATSVQTLASGSGFAEFSVPQTGMYGVVGLSKGEPNEQPDAVDYAIYLSADGRVYSYESGVAFGYSGANEFYAPGDRFRIAVDAGATGSSVTYMKNGVPLPARPSATSSKAPLGGVSTSYPLRVVSSLLTPGGAVDNVTVSGAPVDLATGVVWTVPRGSLSINANSLLKAGASGIPSGAISNASIATGNGYVQFTAGETTTYKMLGLSSSNRSAAYTDIDYAIYLYAGVVYVFEKGAFKFTMPGTYVAGDQFRIAIQSSRSLSPVVKYYRNYVAGAVPFYTSAATPTYPLFVATSIYSAGATLQDVVLAGADQQVVWSQSGSSGVATGLGSVRKTAAPGWNAGSVSTQAMLPGDGYVEFTVTEASLGKRFGLSRANPGHDYKDIDFQFSFPAGGTNDDMAVEEYFRGSPIGPSRTFASYAAGDRFRIGIEGGLVTYRRNGVLLYQNPTPLKPSDFPLLVSTSMYDTGAAFGNATVAGRLGVSGY